MKFLALTTAIVIASTNSAAIPPPNINNIIKQIEPIEIAAPVRPQQETLYI